jgi:N utilization substance protein B
VSKFTRHEIREIALTLLFNAECENARPAVDSPTGLAQSSDAPPEASERLDELYGDLDEAFGLAQSNEAKRLALGVLSHKAEFDAVIARLSPTRQVARIPLMLRTILRMALYEICYADATPDKVAINEAIELAKEYGAGSDPSFVSGLLGNYYRAKQGESASTDSEAQGESTSATAE